MKWTETSEDKQETILWGASKIQALKPLKLLELCLQVPGGDCESLLCINLFKEKNLEI